MLARLEKHLPSIAEAGNRDVAHVRTAYDNLQRCRTIGELLNAARIEYIAPGDASKTHLPESSVDVVFSNSVMEHIPRETIEEIMKESFRILRPGGLAIHSANCGDHYAYFDRKITQIHYLSYSEASWKKWNNSLLFQNRLRPEDFLGMAGSAGLSILLAKQKPNPALLSSLARMNVAPEFLRYSPEQLATTSIDFVAQRPIGKPAVCEDRDAVSAGT
jgi:SAM-dependent methyltransferase